MIYNIITTQTNIYDSFLKTGLIARGLDKNIIKINLFDLHDFAFDRHKSVDDTPYGGGPGMILRVDVIANALRQIQNSKFKIKNDKSKGKIILLTPQGKKFDAKMAKKLAKVEELTIISGRFEGYDERIRNLVDEEISIGDFVLTSGDLPAMILVDAISRQLPKFIEKAESIKEESFETNLLEYPQYTRPVIFKDQKVPNILLSGNHAEIKKWRQNEAHKKTQKHRPDLTNTP